MERNQEIEIEFKNLLNKEEYERLLHTFNLHEEAPVKQINHYLDTDDFQLKSHGCALRIREKKGAYTLTLKQPKGDGLLETHQKINTEQMTAVINGHSIPVGYISSILKDELQVNGSSITYFGSLTTHRFETDYQSGLLVLDKSEYLNVVDYELEFEVSNYEIGQGQFKQLLEQQKIPTRETKNKIVRFYDKKN
ncbi:MULTISPECIES: CYTH domain-containing protein [Bacillus]|uniref:CYTH domain-containing protein n=1 Tax=Bacillus TaxID=1386 RepID=UPI000BB8F14E|nr:MULTISPECIES: CYTH domain-containing protein [Bacillus]